MTEFERATIAAQAMMAIATLPSDDVDDAAVTLWQDACLIVSEALAGAFDTDELAAEEEDTEEDGADDGDDETEA